MIKTITTSRVVLGVKSASVTDFKAAEKVINDLLDTAKANSDNCAGLAANQIGEHLRICVYLNKKGEYVPVVNPRIISRSKEVKSQYESCLSHPDTDAVKVRRYKAIKTKEYDIATKKYVKRTYKGFQARIIQHEIDHMNGKLI